MSKRKSKVKKSLKIKDFGYGQYEKDFEKLLVASRLPAKAKSINFLLTHKNHFLQDIGATFNMLFVVKVEGMEDEDVRKLLLNNLEWLMKTSEFKISALGKEFLTHFKVFIQGIYAVYMERKKEIGDKLTEQEIGYLASIKWVETLRTDEKQMKQFISFWMQGVQWILPAIIGGITKTFIEIYDKQRSTIDDYNECIDVWRECGLIEPIFTISICPNEMCKHYEFLLSSNPRLQKNCPKCGSRWVNIILFKINEPFSLLKLEGKDFSVFLSGYIKMAMSLPVKVIPECYVTIDGKSDAQIDVFLQTPPIIFECKIYEDPQITTYEKMLSIYRNVCKQLVSSMKKIGVKKGYIITNLKLNEKQILRLDEETKRIIGHQKVSIKLIADTTPKKLLEKLSNELKELDKQLSSEYESTMREISKEPLIKLPKKPESVSKKDSNT